jgi:MoaD family protein
MMKIKVRFFGPVRDVFSGREAEVELPSGGRLGELLRRLSDTPEREREIFFEGEAVQPHLVIMKNGCPVPKPEGLNEILQDGDIIALFPFMGGG